MSNGVGTTYDDFYKSRDPSHVYPPEFVVRAFLGTYPRLTVSKPNFKGARVLDLGFGDGRTMPLLANLGMDVHGVEIAEDICQRGKERMRRLGVEVNVQVGRNNRIPYADRYFDHILACHSCYYVDPGSTFDENVSEIARVVKPYGWFVFSAPIGSSYILEGAKDLGEGHMQISKDPYGVRIGSILKKFDDEQEIERAMRHHFGDFSIGACRNDFWGIEEHVWIVVCRRLAPRSGAGTVSAEGR